MDASRSLPECSRSLDDAVPHSVDLCVSSRATASRGCPRQLGHAVRAGLLPRPRSRCGRRGVLGERPGRSTDATVLVAGPCATVGRVVGWSAVHWSRSGLDFRSATSPSPLRARRGGSRRVDSRVRRLEVRLRSGRCPNADVFGRYIGPVIELCGRAWRAVKGEIEPALSVAPECRPAFGELAATAAAFVAIQHPLHLPAPNLSEHRHAFWRL